MKRATILLLALLIISAAVVSAAMVLLGQGQVDKCLDTDGGIFPTLLEINFFIEWDRIYFLWWLYK